MNYIAKALLLGVVSTSTSKDMESSQPYDLLIQEVANLIDDLDEVQVDDKMALEVA